MRKLTLENQNELKPYIELANYNEYNSNTVTMLMWSTMYEIYFECYEHYAIAYSKMPNRSAVWMMPYCEKIYRKQAIEKIQEVSSQENLAFELHSMTKEFKDWLQSTYPNQYLIWSCYNAQDYVYDRAQQETLVGKKMQKRRNHFNFFMKEYANRYLYKPLEKTDIPFIYDFLHTWQAEKESDKSIDAEENGIHLLLENFDELNLLGGCIYIDGNLEAFNITSFLSKDCIEIHVEKANKHIRGLYIAILKFFLETLPRDIMYLNREDDMGNTQLRKAKHDMYPIKKIEKFGSIHQDVHIQKATDEFLPQIKQLWKERFCEETVASTQYYFRYLYQKENCYILTSDNELITMLQLRPMDIVVNQQIEHVSFIVGVATSKEYGGVGYMKTLLHHVLSILKKSQNYTLLQAYHPALYTPFGFKETYQNRCVTLDKSAYKKANGTFHSDYTKQELLALYTQYTKNKEGYRLRNVQDYDTLLAYKAIWNQSVLIHKTNTINDGYIIYTEDSKSCTISECIFTSEEALISMLGMLCEKEQEICVTLDNEQDVIGNIKIVTNMMCKELGTKQFPSEHLFINEEI
ncbi:MAG: GNAT family N-acetyltransferase [Longicatena sp.]